MKTVSLLYEGDEWLSTDSMVLMGIFTSKKAFERNAQKLIRQRAEQHVDDAEGMYYDFDDCKKQRDKEKAVVEDILRELCDNGSTSGWTTNYLCKIVTLDKLEEI